MKAQFACFLFALTLLVPALAKAQPPGPVLRTVQVDCAAGGTLAKALALPAHRLVIEISGACFGDVVIDRDRVTLQGVGADAALVGDPAAPGPGLLVSGASEVNVTTLTIRGGDVFGIAVRRNGEVRLDRVRVVDTPLIGLLVDQGSSAVMIDSALLDLPLFGAAVFGASGLTVQGTNEFSGNGEVGLLLSDGGNVHTQGVGLVIANDNGIAGIALQAGATGLFASVQARRNGFAGVQAAFAANCSSIGTNDFSENGAFGAFVTDGSHLQASGDYRDNGTAGIFATEGAVVNIATDIPSRIDGSPVDVILEGAIGSFITADIDAIDLSFGARAVFGPDVTVDTLTCDGTVLTQGAISCPAPVALTEGLSKVEARSSDSDRIVRSPRLFRLPPN